MNYYLNLLFNERKEQNIKSKKRDCKVVNETKKKLVK